MQHGCVAGPNRLAIRSTSSKSETSRASWHSLLEVAASLAIRNRCLLQRRIDGREIPFLLSHPFAELIRQVSSLLYIRRAHGISLRTPRSRCIDVNTRNRRSVRPATESLVVDVRQAYCHYIARPPGGKDTPARDEQSPGLIPPRATRPAGSGLPSPANPRLQPRQLRTLQPPRRLSVPGWHGSASQERPCGWQRIWRASATEVTDACRPERCLITSASTPETAPSRSVRHSVSTQRRCDP